MGWCAWLVGLCALVAAVQSQTYVSPTGTDSDSCGGDPATACRTLAVAIPKCSGAGLILQPGVHASPGGISIPTDCQYLKGSTTLSPGAEHAVIDGTNGDALMSLQAPAGADFTVSDMEFTNLNSHSMAGLLEAGAGTTLYVTNTMFTKNNGTLVHGRFGAVVHADQVVATGNVGTEGFRLNSTNTDARHTIMRSNFALNTATALYVSAASVRIEDCHFDGNEANYHFPKKKVMVNPADTFRHGGAVYVEGLSRLEVHRSKFTANEASAGGALYVVNGESLSNPVLPHISIYSCEFFNNTATLLSGGAINYAVSEAGFLFINDTAFRHNSATRGWDGGGAVAMYTEARLEESVPIDSVMMLMYADYCLFEDNTVAGYFGTPGGAVSFSASKVGCANGMCMREEVMLWNSKFINNWGYRGGAVYVKGGKADIAQCELTGNVGVTTGGAFHLWETKVNMRNTNMNGNQARGGGAIYVNSLLAPMMLVATGSKDNIATENGGFVLAENADCIFYGLSSLNDTAVESGGMGMFIRANVILNGGVTITDTRSGAMGAITMTACTMKIDFVVTVKDSRAELGAGFYLEKTKLDVSGSLSIINSTALDGGGMYVHGSDVSLPEGGKLSIDGCRARRGGGAMAVRSQRSFHKALCFISYAVRAQFFPPIYLSNNMAWSGGALFYVDEQGAESCATLPIMETGGNSASGYGDFAASSPLKVIGTMTMEPNLYANASQVRVEDFYGTLVVPGPDSFFEIAFVATECPEGVASVSSNDRFLLDQAGVPRTVCGVDYPPAESGKFCTSLVPMTVYVSSSETYTTIGQADVFTSELMGCASGYEAVFDDSRGGYYCRVCPAGTEGTGQTCVPCRPGMVAAYAGSSECVPCELGLYSARSGQLACTRCPDNTASTADRAGCQCSSGYYGSGLDYRSGTVKCEPCPRGGVCEGGSTVTGVQEGYWARQDYSDYIMPCESGHICPGGDWESYELPEGEEYIGLCEDKRMGPRCEECKVGYTMGSSGSCVPCPRKMEVFVAACVTAVLVALPIPILVFLMAKKLNFTLIRLLLFGLQIMTATQAAISHQRGRVWTALTYVILPYDILSSRCAYAAVHPSGNWVPLTVIYLSKLCTPFAVLAVQSAASLVVYHIMSTRWAVKAKRAARSVKAAQAGGTEVGGVANPSSLAAMDSLQQPLQTALQEQQSQAPPVLSQAETDSMDHIAQMKAANPVFQDAYAPPAWPIEPLQVTVATEGAVVSEENADKALPTDQVEVAENKVTDGKSLEGRRRALRTTVLKAMFWLSLLLYPFFSVYVASPLACTSHPWGPVFTFHQVEACGPDTRPWYLWLAMVMFGCTYTLGIPGMLLVGGIIRQAWPDHPNPFARAVDFMREDVRRHYLNHEIFQLLYRMVITIFTTVFAGHAGLRVILPLIVNVINLAVLGIIQPYTIRSLNMMNVSIAGAVTLLSLSLLRQVPMEVSYSHGVKIVLDVTQGLAIAIILFVLAIRMRKLILIFKICCRKKSPEDYEANVDSDEEVTDDETWAASSMVGPRSNSIFSAGGVSRRRSTVRSQTSTVTQGNPSSRRTSHASPVQLASEGTNALSHEHPSDAPAMGTNPSDKLVRRASTLSEVKTSPQLSAVDDSFELNDSMLQSSCGAVDQVGISTGEESDPQPSTQASGRRGIFDKAASKRKSLAKEVAAVRTRGLVSFARQKFET